MYWKKVMVKKKKKEYRDGIAGCAFVIDAVSNGDNGENRQNQPRRRPSHLPISSLSLSLSLKSQVSSLKSRVKTQNNSVSIGNHFFSLACIFLFFSCTGPWTRRRPIPKLTPPFYFYFYFFLEFWFDTVQLLLNKYEREF